MKRRHSVASRRRRMFPPRRSKDADVILRDSFTDASSTNLSAHTPDRNSPGNAWVVAAGTLQIMNNWLSNRAASNVWSYGVIDLETANVDITAFLNCGDPASSSYHGIALRWLDSTHYWRIQYYSTSPGYIKIIEDNGGVTVRASAEITVDPNVTYKIRVLARNDYIKVVAHDGTILTYTSSVHAGNTKHGISSRYAGSIATQYPTMDDLKIKRGLAE